MQTNARRLACALTPETCSAESHTRRHTHKHTHERRARTHEQARSHSHTHARVRTETYLQSRKVYTQRHTQAHIYQTHTSIDTPHTHVREACMHAYLRVHAHTPARQKRGRTQHSNSVQGGIGEELWTGDPRDFHLWVSQLCIDLCCLKRIAHHLFLRRSPDDTVAHESARA